MAVAVVATAWRSVPLIALLLLAALKTIPEALYRAARMDGASTWQRFRYVTLPAIRNTMLVVDDPHDHPVAPGRSTSCSR